MDYLIICEGLREYLEKMFIDEKRIFALTKYSKKGQSYNKVSDHNIIIGRFKLKFNRINHKLRTEFFNFKNKENQKIFFEKTSITEKMSGSFSTERTFPHNCNMFFKNLKSVFHTSFEKIRVMPRKPSNQGDGNLQDLLKLKMELRMFLKNNQCLIAKRIAEKKLEETETYLTDNFATKTAELIRDHLKEIEIGDGKFSRIGFWKVKKKLFPQVQDSPMAKKNEEGQPSERPLSADIFSHAETKRDEA